MWNDVIVKRQVGEGVKVVILLIMKSSQNQSWLICRMLEILSKKKKKCRMLEMLRGDNYT